MIEHKIPQDDQLFDDKFDFLDGASLADLYLESLRKASEQHHDGSVTRPYPIWRARGGMYIPEYGMSIAPEAYHPATDLDQATPEQIIDTAKSHYDKLREFGMKVVGHVFEPIDPGSDDFETHPDYPTILVGVKHLTKSRLNDRVEDKSDGISPERLAELESAAKQLGISAPTAEEYREARLDIGNERYLDLEDAEQRGFTTEEYQEMLLNPIRSYLEWCKESGQTYMHTGLSRLSAYLYQRRQHALGIWQPTSLMNRTSFEGNFVPVGALYTEAEEFGRFTLELTGKEEKLEMPL